MRAQGFEIEHCAPLAEQQAAGAAHKDVPILPDVNFGLLVLETPDREIGSDARFTAVCCKKAHIGDQPARARTRVFGPGSAAHELPDARGERAPVVGDQEQGVAVIGVRGIERRHQIAPVGRHQCQPLLEPPFVEEGRLINEELLDLAAREGNVTGCH